MKAIVWANPNRMQFHSGHKTFDSQTNVLMAGNVLANTLYGRHIRPSSETECGPMVTRPPGHLQAWDLDHYMGRHPLPQHIRRDVEQRLTNGRGGWLYCVFHHSPRARGGLVIHGYILAAYDHTLAKVWYTGPTYKSEAVLDEVISYITEEAA